MVLARNWILSALLLLSSSHYDLWGGQGSIGLVSAGENYKPRQAVRRMHNMPHLDSNLKTVDNTFSISASSAYNEYTKSLVVFPVILGALGLIVLIGYLFGLLFRFCCTCCWSPPTKKSSNSETLNYSKRNLTIAFMSCIIVILSFDLTILKGNQSLNTGVNRAIDAVDFVGDIFQSKLAFLSI
jgi:hypothetical protein